MANVNISFGYDTERPYGDWAKTSQGAEFRIKQLEFLRRLNTLFDSYSAPRTFFILGDYLEQSEKEVGSEKLRTIFDVNNKLNDIQQHTFSHPLLKTLKELPDRKPISQEYFLEDVKKADQTIKQILGVTPKGLRTPIGYPEDLSDSPEIINGLRSLGLPYVSSWLRTEDFFGAPVSLQRQPFLYPNALVEIPSAGWYDLLFTQEKSQQLLHKNPKTEEEIKKYYLGLLYEAKLLAEKTNKTVYIPLCLHPWAAMEYDPELNIHKFILDYCKKENIEVVSYSQIVEELISKNKNQ